MQSQQDFLEALAQLKAFQKRVGDYLEYHFTQLSEDEKALLQKNAQQNTDALQQFASRIERNTENIARAGLQKAVEEHKQSLLSVQQAALKILNDCQQTQLETQKMFRWVGVKAHALFAIVVLLFFGLAYWQYASLRTDYDALKVDYQQQLIAMQQASEMGSFRTCGKEVRPCAKIDKSAGEFEGGYMVLDGAKNRKQNK